jgi:starvation-inducible DNA-binding protein
MKSEKVNVGLQEEHREAVVDVLNSLLADQFLLYTKTRNYHWNVIGPRFPELHKFFEEQYGDLEEMMDETAEVARQFGGFAAGTMAEFIDLSRLKEHRGDIPDENGMLQNLLADHESIIRNLRQDIDQADEEYNAADAADFLTGTLEKHNKMAWMLRSTLGVAPRKREKSRRTSDELVGSSR